MISVNRLGVSFGGSFIFKDISFVINSRDKIGLVGRNGAGKTTLLRILMKLQQPDDGEVSISGGIRPGYLPQQMIIRDERTLFEEAETAFGEIMMLDSEINQINLEISGRTDYESMEYMDLLEQLSEKTERFHLLEGSSRDQKIEQVLKGLGFKREDFDRPTYEFSGGWRMRIELAKILLKSPDVILLDEPTNHLDIDSIQWLEEFLREYHGAVVLISHDRAFLDHVTSRTIEITLGTIYDYRLPYSEFLIMRKERHDQQVAASKNQQKLIGGTTEFIEKFRYKATKAVQVQSRIKMLEKINIIEIDEEDTSQIKMCFPPAPRSGITVFDARDLSFSYGAIPVLDNVTITIRRGDRLAFVGRNGEGKTTLSRIITGELPGKGKIKTGYQVVVGYFAQNQDELLDGNNTVFGTLNDVAAGEIRTKIRDILGSFLFSGDEVEKKVKVLSGGERSRLALAQLLLKPCNMLVLDEPTNHLDMRSKDILKQALLQYDGTLIIVSHDREFLDGLVTKVYEFGNGKIKEYMGGIYEYLHKRKLDSLKDLEKDDKKSSKIQKKENEHARQTYLKKKEFDREIKRIENSISKTEDLIEDLENKLKEYEQQLEMSSNNSETAHQSDGFTRYKSLQDEIGSGLALWEKLHKELEHLKSKRN